MGGYPTALFLSEDIKPEFICTICHDVLKAPCMLYPCGHLSCRECYKTWEKESQDCPICRQHVKKVRDVPRCFLNLLNGLRIRCPFNEDVTEAGCGAVLKLEDIETHKVKCQKKRTACVHGCGAQLKRAEVAEHSCVKWLRRELLKEKEKRRDKEDELEELQEELDEMAEENESLRRKLGKRGWLRKMFS